MMRTRKNPDKFKMPRCEKACQANRRSTKAGRQDYRAAWTVFFRASEETNIPSRIPSSGHLLLRLNRKILNVAQLRLRFCSIGATESGPNPGVIPVYLLLPSPLTKAPEAIPLRCGQDRRLIVDYLGLDFASKTRLQVNAWFLLKLSSA
jgi:hypothetical protein